jgi:serine O-acetyltransferase
MKELIIPGNKDVEQFIYTIFKQLFPNTCSLTEAESDDRVKNPEERMIHILSFFIENKEEVVHKFINQLDKIKEKLLSDANFILESDPAATQLIEVIAIYPGFFGIFCYRIANVLAELNVPLFPRMITEYAHKVTGIDIHPRAKIGSPFSIDHGTGIVIGETTVIGDNVKLYQGVTLGALSVEKSKSRTKRHPTIEDNVILYSGCTILGGETVIGRNSIIGGNVWLTESIVPNTVVYHKGEVFIRKQDV